MMSPGTGACATEKHTLDFKLRPGLSLSLLLVAAVLVCYHPVIYNGFLNYDDDAYITSNAHVRAGLNWKTVKWAFTSYDAANYHPLTWLSHAFDCQLFGLKSGAHHEVSVILHAACAVLLFCCCCWPLDSLGAASSRPLCSRFIPLTSNLLPGRRSARMF